MPTPNGRAWLTSDAIAQRMLDKLMAKLPKPAQRALSNHPVLSLLKEAYEDTDYTLEFKILRLNEKLKDAISNGVFGPLSIPNTVDVEGQKILTPVGQIAEMFGEIYSPEFLDMFDEEGEML